MRMEGDQDDHDVYYDGDEDLIAYEEGDDHDVYVDDNVYGDHDEYLISFEEAHNKYLSAGGGRATLLAIYRERPSNQN